MTKCPIELLVYKDVEMSIKKRFYEDKHVVVVEEKTIGYEYLPLHSSQWMNFLKEAGSLKSLGVHIYDEGFVNFLNKRDCLQFPINGNTEEGILDSLDGYSFVNLFEKKLPDKGIAIQFNDIRDIYKCMVYKSFFELDLLTYSYIEACEWLHYKVEPWEEGWHTIW